MPEAEAQQMNGELTLLRLDKHGPSTALQVVHRELGGVDDRRGPDPNGLQPRTLQPDGLCDRLGLSYGDQRVLSPRLIEAGDQPLIAGVEVDEPDVLPRGPEGVQVPGHVSAQGDLPHVHDHRDLLDRGVLLCQSDEGLEERRREVVDAEVASILESAKGCGLARAGQTAEYDEFQASAPVERRG